MPLNVCDQEYCPVTVMVTRNGSSSYSLSFSVANNASHCTVPSGSVNNTNGQFTSATYVLDWAT